MLSVRAARAAAPDAELRAALGAHQRALLAVALFSLVINLLGLVPSLYMLQIYDRVLASRSLGTLWAISAIALGLLALLAALEWARARVLVRVGNRLDDALGARVFDAAFAAWPRHASGAPEQPLADVQALRQFVSGPLAAYMDLPWAPIYLLACFLLHPVLGGVALVGLLGSVALAVVTARLTGPTLDAAQQLAVRATSEAGQQVRQAETVAAMGLLPALRSRWWRAQQQVLAGQSLASDRAAALQAVSKNFRIGMQSVVLGAGAWLVVGNESTPGAMIAASILMGRALGPVDHAIGSWKAVVSARAAWRRLAGLLAEEPPPLASLALPAPQGLLQVEALHVVPPGATQAALRGVSFVLQPGEILGVVGPSGSGKSTLARALVGAWPAASGAVRLDAADVASFSLNGLGVHVGYLPQEAALLDGTVAENIARMGPPDAERVVQAARAADVHELVLRLPQGYETRVGPGGSALSGGQRQRLALARALYGQPALLVLDEPNANLDEAGEAALLQALQAARRERRTVVVIAHRLNILQAADHLLVLNEGVVAAWGPRERLLQMRAAQAGARANPPHEPAMASAS